jgi:hypothetical protein
MRTEGRTGYEGAVENVLSLGMQHEALAGAVQPIVLHCAGAKSRRAAVNEVSQFIVAQNSSSHSRLALPFLILG